MRNFVNDIKKNTHTESQAARKKVTQEKNIYYNNKTVALLFFLSAACSLPESVQVGGDPRPPEQGPA